MWDWSALIRHCTLYLSPNRTQKCVIGKEFHVTRSDCNQPLKRQSLRDSIVLCFNRYSEEDNDQSFQEVKRNERKKKRQRVRLHVCYSPCEVVLWFLYFVQYSSNSSSTTSTGSVSHQQQSSNIVDTGNNSNGSSSISFGGGRYHHREVPPRFQHHKQNKGPKHSSKFNQGILCMAVVV